MEREISNIHSSSSDIGEPSSSVASSSVAVAGDETNAQEDARNNKNYAWTAEKKYGCRICKKGFNTRHALYGHMRTHPRAWRGVEPPPAAAAERQGHDVRESAEEEQRGRNGRESTSAAEQSSPDRELAPTDQSAEDDEDVKWWNMEAVVDQLLFLMKKSTHMRQGNDGRNSENNIPSDNSTVGGSGGGGGVFAAGAGAGEGVVVDAVVVDAIIPACNETVSDEKKEKSSKKKRSRDSGVHTCEECGKTFAKGQSLGGHMRKHYDIEKIIEKRRAREKQKKTPAPAVERRVQEPAALTGNTVTAMVEVEEERTASFCSAPLESHNPVLLLQSVQLEGPSAANGARRPHDIDLNEPAEPEEEHENAPQPELERKDDDPDDLLSFRLWPKFDSQRSN